MTSAGGNGSGVERVTLERQLPYVAQLQTIGKEHIFDGSEEAFPAWKWRIQRRLAKLKLAYTLLRTPEEEDFANATAGATAKVEEARVAKMAKRMEDDVEAMDEIIQSVNNVTLNKIVGFTYAKDAMDVLVQTYQKVGTGAMICMRDRLFTLKSRRHENLSRLFDEYDTIVRELERMSAGISAAEKVHALLIAMPDSFNHVKGALTVLPNEELCRKSITDIKRMFLDAEITGRNHGGEPSHAGNNVAFKTAKRPPVRCFECGETGHYKNKCPKLNKKKPAPKGRSRSFAMMAERPTNNHTRAKEMCGHPHDGLNVGKQQPAGARFCKPGIEKTASSIRSRLGTIQPKRKVCFVDVPNATQRAEAAEKKMANIKRSLALVAGVPEKKKRTIRFVPTVQQRKKQEIPTPRNTALEAGPTDERKKTVRFVVDSGASEHMINDDEMLEDSVWLDEPVEIATAKTGQTLRATKKGKINLSSVVGLNKTKLTLYNVLFIPGLEANLLSVRKANTMGKRVTFQDGRVLFESAGEVIAKGEVMDGLFRLDLFLEKQFDQTALYGKNQVSLENWHKRLGHLSFSGIEKMIRHDMVEGINLATKDCREQQVCESCLAGKQTVQRFEQMVLPRSSRPLELVHTDVCGFMEEATYDGNRYFVSFIDDFTHFTVIYLIKRKSDVLTRFKEFEAMASAHFGQKLSKLRSDNGREYVGKEFQDYCKIKGIQMVLTVPYTPQQNGVSERINRTLMEKVRAMIYDSGLPKSMWGEAVYCATYLVNRSPTNALVENKTPYEMWYQKRPNLSKLRIFGCKAFAQIPKEKRHKLDPKTKRLTFVGYANNGYRLWNSQTRSIEISRNVIFDESATRKFSDYNDRIQVPLVIDETPDSCGNDEAIKTETVGIDDSIILETDNAVTQIQSEVWKNFGSKPVSEDIEETDKESLDNEDVDTENNDIESQSDLRRSKREKKNPVWYSAHIASMTSEELPQNIDELKKRDDWPQWKTAINDELKSLEENKTWEVVNSLPSGKRTIRSKWVFSIKENGRYKARLVAKGCSQRPGFDYEETFAPVSKMESVRTILSLANEFKLLAHQMDVKTAFLYGELEEVIYMQLPNDEMGNSEIVRLQKSLYGLKQASRSWNKKFDDAVKSLGFTSFKNDCCVYKSQSKHLFLILYVDDILIVGKNLEQINWIKSELGRLFQMTDMQEVKHFLGMEIKRDFEKQILEISQVGYTERILRRFGMYECKPVGTPLDPNVRWSKTNDKETDQPYKELIGCLQYLAITSRPDICAAVSVLSRYQSCASDAHWAGLKRILRYLRGTVDTKLIFSKKENVPTLLGFADADFANDTDDRKSISGYSFQVFGNLVSWSTKRQQTVSLSSSEAELIALCYAVKEGLWLTKLLNELNVVSIPFMIMEDNIPCIKYSEAPRDHQRMKHLDIKYMFVRELIKTGKLKLKFIPSEDQPADAFTKGLPQNQHRRLLQLLGVRIGGKC